jgi:DNA-binding response OmpR family regulator
MLVRQRGPRLLLDEQRGQVLLDGQLLDLSRTPLYLRLLRALLRHGGAASKEQLVKEAWGLKTYAPLRDDNRLQVTIGRLRKILGRETILACEDGYRLAGPGALSARLDTNPEVG